MLTEPRIIVRYTVVRQTPDGRYCTEQRERVFSSREWANNWLRHNIVGHVTITTEPTGGGTDV